MATDGDSYSAMLAMTGIFASGEEREVRGPYMDPNEIRLPKNEIGLFK